MQGKSHKLWGILFSIIIITILIGVIAGYKQSSSIFYHIDSSLEDESARIIEIQSEEGYLAFAETVSTNNNYKNCQVILCTDLDFSGYEEFPVIGLGEEENVSFMGTFDGNGYVISGVHISREDGNVGMFAKLGGIVKNLRVENSSFHGSLCGAIAAENCEGAILNCYVDAQVDGEIAGAVVGKNDSGLISNCVASSTLVGISEDGSETYCYLDDEYDLEALNENICSLSGRYADVSFCCWEEAEDSILSKNKKNLLETLTTSLDIAGQIIDIKGYYSAADEQWCFALPAAYGDTELFIEARTNFGDSVSFERSYGEKTVDFVLEGVSYRVRFLTADNIETIYVALDEGKSLNYVHANKREEIPGRVLTIDTNGKTSDKTIRGFYGHGNSSWESDKKSYNLKFDSYVDLFGMGANDDYVLLAGYRLNSLMSYGIATELSQESGFDYAPEFRYVNLYVNGEYAGVYFLTEKIEIDTNRLEITSIYDETKKVNTSELETFEHQTWEDSETQQRRHYYTVETNPKDITGGYLLEIDFFDYDELQSRFTTKYQRNKIVLKRAAYSSKEQVNYIADVWQEFEDGLFSEDGYNEKGKHYTEYIDLESFAMQWLMYELSKEDSMKSSIYYYKESDLTGDGLIHACYPWDMERSYIALDKEEKFGSVNEKSEYWAAFYQHEDFREELARVWNEKFVPALELMLKEKPMETKSGLRNISWYEENIADVSKLENSRWEDCDMLKKCDTIRSILEVRKKLITEELSRYGDIQ